MAETINLGIVGIKNMGEYDSETQYEKLNVVTYQGSSYCALRDTKGNSPTNTDYWQLYAEKGGKGDRGSTGATGGPGPKGDTGNPGSSPIAVSALSEMTDTTRIYVNTTNGHWYSYDGTTWQDGGIYQSTGISDKSITYAMLESKLQNLIELVYEEMTLNYNLNGFYSKSGGFTTNANQTTCKLEVNPGEMYKYDGWCLGNMRCIIAIDENNNYLGTTEKYMVPEINAFPNPKEHMIFEYTVPIGCKYLYVLNYDSVNVTHFYKVSNYAIADIPDFENTISNLNYEIEQLQKFNIEEQIKNDFKWNHTLLNGKYAVFTFDDSNTDIDIIEDLFESRNVPCCFATIPSKLNNITTNGETVKEVLQRAVDNGGEVLSHWGSPLTSASSDSDYYKVYIGCKKTLRNEGFDVNGIITAGGTDYTTQDFAKDIEIARNNYLYADLTAVYYTNVEQYWNRRNFLDSGVNSIKSLIDNYVSGTGTQPYSKWLNFASHGTNTTSISEIAEIIDYCIDRGVQIVTWKYLYDHFKSSYLEERIYNLEQ